MSPRFIIRDDGLFGFFDEEPQLPRREIIDVEYEEIPLPTTDEEIESNSEDEETENPE